MPENSGFIIEDGVEMKKAYYALTFGLIFLAMFVKFNHVDISHCSVESKKFSKEHIALPFSHTSFGNEIYTYTCRLDSLFEQTSKIGIAVDEKLLSVKINGEDVDLDRIKKQYGQKQLKDWQRGYFFSIPLLKGDNTLQIVGSDAGGRFGISIGQGLSYFEYFLLFVFSVIPIVFGVYSLFFGYFVKAIRHIGSLDLSKIWGRLPFVIIIAGAVLRLLFLVYVPNTMYQHDFKDHMDAVHYFSERPFEMPQPDKSVQFPQQPLYYWMSAAVYSVSADFGFNEHDRIYSIRVMSVVFSILWLYAGLMLIRLYSKNRLITNLFTAFLSFTPSFVFLSVAVNNDSLNALLGIISIYTVSAFFISRHRRFFYYATIAILLAMMTKISSVLLALYFVVILLVMYFQAETDKDICQKSILKFGIAVLFVFGFSLVKSYVPSIGEFRFVNSALYGGQVIKAFDLTYFLSFHITDLISTAQAYVMGTNDIRFSLPTYMYGTMFTGEFNFAKHFKSGTFFQLWAQATYLFGLIYIVGLASYIYFYKKLKVLEKLLIVPVVINLILIIKFLSDFWVVCNSDFRYFTPTFAAIGLIFVLGIDRLLKRYQFLIKPVSIFAGILAVSEVLWITNLIRFG